MSPELVSPELGPPNSDSVKAGLAKRAEDWPWSSARAHCNGGEDPLAESTWLEERIAGWICTWSEYLLEPDEAELAVRMRQLENTGRPLGDRGFVERLSRVLGRDLVPKRPGPKAETES